VLLLSSASDLSDGSEDPESDDPFCGEWGMFSPSGEDEVEEVLGASSSVRGLLRRMARAKHSEMNDTDVRDRMVESIRCRRADDGMDQDDDEEGEDDGSGLDDDAPHALTDETEGKTGEASSSGSCSAQTSSAPAAAAAASAAAGAAGLASPPPRPAPLYSLVPGAGGVFGLELYLASVRAQQACCTERVREARAKVLEEQAAMEVEEVAQKAAAAAAAAAAALAPPSDGRKRKKPKASDQQLSAATRHTHAVWALERLEAAAFPGSG